MRSDKPDRLSKLITGPVPFWFLNGPITRDRVARELQMIFEKGVREVVVHPRYGLDVDYPRDGWFELFGWCLEEARSLGMFVWIYDELNWPSGTAGMTVQTENPEFAGQYLAVSVREENAPPPEVSPDRLLVAARIRGGRVTKTSRIRSREALQDLGPGWTFFECEPKRDPYYIDTLSKAAVDAFKSSTYEEYYRRFGPEFGKTIRAAFTDEPSIYWVSVGYDDWNLPYTDLLFPSFTTRYGYPAEPMVPYLFFPGHEAPAFRADFWEHVSHLFNENYHGNLGDWCREHGIVYTGHNNHEEPLRYQIRFQGDMFGTMRAMDVPGVDHLGKATLGNQWISIIGHKIASSSAHAEGKSRVMSESFGVTGWDTTYLDLKKIVDWQFSLGVNLLVPHALFHCTAGPRKRESPPSFFHQSPHWEDFDAFSAYVDRLSDALTGGRHVCRILVLYPLTGLWSAYQPDRRTPEMDFLENFLDSICLELMSLHLDFDLVDFTALQSAAVEDGRIVLADEAYDALIVPPSNHLRGPEQRRIAEIAESGVITSVLYRSGGPLDANRPRQGKIAFVPTEDLRSMIIQLSGLFNKDIRLSGSGHEDVTLLQREKDGEPVLFLANRADSSRRVTLSVPGRPRLVARRPEDGRPVPLSSHSRGDRTEAALSMQAYESLLINVGPEAAEAPEEHAPGPSVRRSEIDGLTVSAPYNAAMIFRFDYAGSGGAREVDVREHPVYIPVNWDPNPPDFTVWAGEYTAALDIDADPAGLRLVLDEEYAEHELYVNGRRASLRKADPLPMDWDDLEPEEPDLLVKGRNEFRVVTKTRLSEPIRVIGDFGVILEERNLRVVERTSEVDTFEPERVYPFFSGTVTYRAGVDLDDLPRNLVVDLGDVRDTAAVYVNGELAGKRLWPPYRIDIADFARLGVNELTIEVRNNLANLMLGQPRPFGLRSAPVLESEG